LDELQDWLVDQILEVVFPDLGELCAYMALPQHMMCHGVTVYVNSHSSFLICTVSEATPSWWRFYKHA
jgi:hypothetical protein